MLGWLAFAPPRDRESMTARSLRLALPLLFALCLALVGGSARAAPSTGLKTGGSVDTSGASGQASTSGKAPKLPPGPKSSGFELPERVYGGNAISALMPAQVAFVGYMPRVRLGFQYDRQLFKEHWAYVGVAALFDGVATDAKGRVVVDAATCRTGNPKVFAGGDCVNGGKEVVNAVADGRNAARAMHADFSGGASHG